MVEEMFHDFFLTLTHLEKCFHCTYGSQSHLLVPFTTFPVAGPNILLARLATRVAKPNGLYQLEEAAAKEFLKDRSVSDLPGKGITNYN